MTTTENSRADALTDEQIAALKQTALAATPQNIDSAQSIDHYNDGRFIECPCCSGEGSVELEADFLNYDGKALGVQFYGIGNEPGAAEAYFRAASPANILALLARLESAESALAASPVEQPAAAPIDGVVGPLRDDQRQHAISLYLNLPHSWESAQAVINSVSADAYVNGRKDAAPAPSPADERAAFGEEWMLVKRARIEEIKRYTYPKFEESYQGRGLYDEDAVRRNANLGEEMLTNIQSELEWIDEDTKNFEAERAASATETGAEGADALAHEVWSAAQRAPGEGIEDAVQRIAAILSRSPAMSTQPVRAWETDDGRVISDEQKQGAQAADPVAWRYLTPTGWHATTKLDKALGASAHHDMEPLYAAPQPAQADARVGLTDEQRDVLTWAIGRANAQGEDACADVLRSILASQPGRPEPRSEVTDTARLDWLRDETCDLRCVDIPTGDGDSEVRWVVVQHHMSKPHEREIGRSVTEEPREAIDAARAGEKQ
ncbi:hypothetical protein [Burkholderia vietnamiensis]|uniref:hypothetical protein n=1 Tax=Burkholderia vietnamiensis TaxID=60552 RepID=UPI001CF584E8|nr:hypothetical protein [Burkholderia vietnamiensis]MCA7945623.1 hypothetical protein [Burkholderia vietnamiensis]